MNGAQSLRWIAGLCACLWAGQAMATIEVNGREMEVVDAHIHGGKIGDFNLRGKQAILNFLPPFVRLYHPGMMGAQVDPYVPFLGLKAERDRAGIDHGVLLAAFTHHTAAFLNNRDAESFLSDSRNVRGDGTRWAWGMASINWDEFFESGNERARLDALQSYIVQRPDLFIGIKLAHVHAGVAFDDERYLGVYDVAADAGVPVLLHTGILSNWGEVLADPHQTDPAYLQSVIEAYDGDHGHPRVDFVLAHVGTGDLKSAVHAIELAANHDNVWLELSSLGNEIFFDEEREPIETDEWMYKIVLEKVQEYGVEDRLIYANGEAKPGWAKSYLNGVVEAMVELGYTDDQIEGTLSKNFYRCFFGS